MSTLPHATRRVQDALRDTFTNDCIISQIRGRHDPPTTIHMEICLIFETSHLSKTYAVAARSIGQHVAQIIPYMLRATVDHAGDGYNMKWNREAKSNSICNHSSK